MACVWMLTSYCRFHTPIQQDAAWVPIGADGMLFGGTVRKEHEVLEDM